MQLNEGYREKGEISNGRRKAEDPEESSQGDRRKGEELGKGKRLATKRLLCI